MLRCWIAVADDGVTLGVFSLLVATLSPFPVYCSICWACWNWSERDMVIRAAASRMW